MVELRLYLLDPRRPFPGTPGYGIQIHAGAHCPLHTLDQNATGENIDWLLIVPYLPDAMLDELDRERQIIATDLCGNGIIKKLPLYIRQSAVQTAILIPVR